MYKYIIKYYYGSDSGERTVFADDDEQAIAKMWKGLARYMSLPMAYKSQEIVFSEKPD